MSELGLLKSQTGQQKVEVKVKKKEFLTLEFMLFDN